MNTLTPSTFQYLESGYSFLFKLLGRPTASAASDIGVGNVQSAVSEFRSFSVVCTQSNRK